MDIKIVNNNLKFKVRVSSVLIINNKLLVEKYSENSYCLPGGYVEVGETSAEAIKREIKEELNIDINIENLIGVFENFFTNFKNEKTHAIDFYYKVMPKNVSDVNLNDYDYLENDKGYEILHHFKWVEINDLDNYNLLPKELIFCLKNDSLNIFHKIIMN